MSGVGAHHQNAVAECSIGTIVCSACAMMIHAAIYWSKTSDSMVWPFALEYAVDLWNHLPYMDTGLSPLDKFSGTIKDYSCLLEAHVWGCPVYVLDPTLQDRKKIPK
eukprot:8850192-Ditylum_brightwellii.AAC.1